MERVVDKLILLALCAFTMLLSPYSPWNLAAILVALSVTALFDVDILPKPFRAALVLAYLGLCFFLPRFLTFLPLIGYDCFRLDKLLTPAFAEARHLLRLSWVLPLFVGFFWLSSQTVLLLGLIGALANLSAWRSVRSSATLADYRASRDELSAISYSLENKNRDLEERQTLELRLATLAERSRISREIHDNVGHLLTRSVLQVEALRVVNASDTQTATELATISETLHEAYETIRESVHNLREEAFDLHTQLLAMAQETEALARVSPGSERTALQVKVNYELQTEQPPQDLSYTLLAIVREALANTLKHSDATTLQISLLEFPGLYQLIVQDNGSKVPSKSALTGGDGIGLVNMEERARSLGGALYTSWNNGFKIFASLPKGS